MRKLVAIAVGGAVLCAVAVLPTTSHAAGCYRLGETGYHWYDFCLGPTWLYPHHRVCRHGHCWYQ
jgi:hypothetical protein